MRILIIEDEARIANRIARMTRSFFEGQLKMLTLCESVPDGLKQLDKETYNLVLLDLNLNGADGFEVLKQTAAAAFHTIIISAYQDKAITAFEYGVLDFVPKPFNEERLAQAFLRTTDKPQEIHTRYLAIKKRGNIVLIDINELRYIQGAGIYTELHLKNGQKEIHDKSLEKLEQLLPDTFERIHKSYLVEMGQAREILIESGSQYKLLLENGEQLPIGRTRYKQLKERMLA